MTIGLPSAESGEINKEVVTKFAVHSKVDIESYPPHEAVPTFAYYLQKSVGINPFFLKLIREKIVEQKQGEIAGASFTDGSLAYSDDTVGRGEEIIKAEKIPGEKVTGWFIVHKDERRGVGVEIVGGSLEQAEKLANLLKQSGLPGTANLTVLLKNKPADFIFIGANQWFDGLLAGFNYPRK